MTMGTAHFSKYFLAVRSIFVITKVNYRIKSINNGNKTLDEIFITKLSKNDEQLNSHMNRYIQSLLSLKCMGFQTYQLVEHPKLLRLDADELNRRYQLITSFCDKSLVTLNMLKVAKTKSLTDKLKGFINAEIENKSATKSYTENLKRALRCNETEMLELFIKNPRLGGQRKQSNLILKIELLLKNGAKIEHIKNNTSLLNNIPFDVLEKRVEKLSSIGYNNPLPVASLGRAENDFVEIINKLINKEELASQEKIRCNIEILNKIPLFKSKNLYRHIDKIEYLISKGYKETDIIKSPNILTHSLSKIKTSVEYFEKFHLNLVPLALCNNYSNKKSTVLLKRYRHKSKLLSIIGSSATNEPSIFLPDGLKTQMFDDVSLCKSLEYLLELGFTREHIIQLPPIICYDCSLLQLVWDEMIHSDVNYTEKFANNKLKLLNMMLYKIEKLEHFASPHASSLSDNQESSVDDDFGHHHNRIYDYNDTYSSRIKVNNSIDYEETSFEKEQLYKFLNSKSIKLSG